MLEFDIKFNYIFIKLKYIKTKKTINTFYKIIPNYNLNLAIA